MTHNPYPQYTSKWTNIRMGQRLTEEQYKWLCNHVGGQFHIHNMQQAVKFERKQDAEWFILRWS